MFDDPWSADILFRSLVSVPVMISQSQDIIWGVPTTRKLTFTATAKGGKTLSIWTSTALQTLKTENIYGKYSSYRNILQEIDVVDATPSKSFTSSDI